VALGFGDVNLSGVLGLLLGWPAILVGLLLAVLLAGIVSLIYLIIMLALRRYRLFTALPYGPFLIAGAGLIIFFRDGVIRLLGR
jgi:leader peptidase (prepilin peptidase)/N-methyltransferase